MILIQRLKNSFENFFISSPFSLEVQPAIIPIRHMQFDFDPKHIDPKFYLNVELASAYD